MKVILALLVILAIPVMVAHAQTDQIVRVEPYPYSIWWYHFHILQPGEKPTYLNFHCWGCTMSDIHNIEKIAGLQYWPEYQN